MDYSSGKHCHSCETVCALPFCAQTYDVAPSFTAEAYFNQLKKIGAVSLDQYKGSWVVLFFYSSDFTFV